MAHITLKRLRWIATFAPPILIGLFEMARNSFPWAKWLPIWAVNLLEMGLLLTGTLWFAHLIFGQIQRITQENERRRQEAEALFEVGTQISALLASEQVLQSVVEHARRLLSADVATLGLVMGEDRSAVRVVATSGMTLEQLEVMRARMDHALPVEAVIHTGKPSFDEFPDAPTGEVRCRLVPLLTGEEVIGSLCIGTREQRYFSADEKRVLSRLSNQAAIAIENARLQTQAQQIAVLEERERISRELHDGLGQTLSYLALKMDMITELLEARMFPAAQVELERIRKATRNAAIDVRESILGLRTSLVPGTDRVTVLKHYLTQYGELNGIAAELVAGEGAQAQLSTATEIQLMRIIQEAMANVRKHAQATKVRVCLEKDKQNLKVSVEDDGQGFRSDGITTQAGVHFGLAVMRERALAIGGELSVDSALGRGTRVCLQIPLGAQ